MSCASYDEIISCPAFRIGYDHVWRGCDLRGNRSWSDDEWAAYERGRRFGSYVRAEEGRRISLMCGGLPSSQAKMLLMMAFRSGDVS